MNKGGYDSSKGRRGKIAERLVLSELEKRGYYGKIIEGESDGWGGELAQLIVLKDGFKTICPDIEIYEDVWENEVILRVEVKSLYQLDNGCAYIKEEQLKKYVVLQAREEVEIRIVFVIGEFEVGEHEFYWIRLSDLQHVKFQRNLFDKCIHWKLEDIKKSGYTGFDQF